MTIAILDDDLDEIYKIQNLILNIEGDYQIHHYQSGHVLLEAIQSGKHLDLLFCDVFMREENGLNVAREVHRISPQTGIAYITFSREHAVEAIAMDVLHYLVKPVRQEDIVEVFRRLEKKAEPRHVLTMHHITRMTFRECVSRDGCTFLLRRDQAKEIREKYHAFVRRELANSH